MLRSILAAALLAAFAMAPGAHALEGTFISLDDERLMDDHVIIPVLEYVELVPDAQGALTLEVGYLYPAALALNVISYVEQLDPAAVAHDVGHLQLAAGRRATLRGPATVGDGTLSWEAELFVSTRDEPPHRVARQSPFQAAAEQGAQASVAALLSGDLLLVTGEDGTVHRYGRADMERVRMTTLLTRATSLAYRGGTDCLAPLAHALASDEPYVFSEATLAPPLEDVSPETVAAMRAYGLDVLLRRYLAALARANEGAGRLLEAEIAGYGSFRDYIIATAGMPPILDEDRRLRLFAVVNQHVFEAADLETPFQYDADAIEERLAARYAEDPWAVTTPYIAFVTPDNWVNAMIQMLNREARQLCPQE